MSFKKVIDLCEKSGFLKRHPIPKVTDDMFKLGPIGAVLQESLRTEWLESMLINKDNTVFLLSDGTFSDIFDTVKQLCLETLPFGIAEFQNGKKSIQDMLPKENETKDDINFGNCFESNTLMRCTMFVSSSTSLQFFHHWQRHRRMWWRRFSASPGHYSLSDIRSDDKNNHVDVLAKYPWGPQVLEKITLHTNNHSNLNTNQLQFKEGRKICRAHYITSDVCLPTMILNTLCDAFEEPVFQGTKRPLFRFHRKIAPYKISFAISGSQRSVINDLQQLALYLCKQLRSNQISTLLIPSSTKYTLDAQWKQYDQLGIPYNILLNENTLKNGIIQLRSRDTTLKEQVHVTNLKTYVEQLFKNY